jgi:hypothetical protein
MPAPELALLELGFVELSANSLGRAARIEEGEPEVAVVLPADAAHERLGVARGGGLVAELLVDRGRRDLARLSPRLVSLSEGVDVGAHSARLELVADLRAIASTFFTSSARSFFVSSVRRLGFPP